MHLDSFIVSALLLLAVTSVAVTLFRQLGLGSMLGLLVAGMVVGPYSPGPYVTDHVEDVQHFTELGVILLLFVIGLEFRPRRLWSLRRELFGLGSLQILITGLALTLCAWLSMESWKTALFIGLTLALSSTALVMQLLQERGEFNTHYGTGSFAILLMQDLAVVPLLALVPLLSDSAPFGASTRLPEQILILTGMFALLWVFGARVVPFTLDWLARHKNRDAFLLVVFLAVFLAAWSMHLAGVSMALGAFIMGMLLSGSRYNLQIRAHIEPYKTLLMSLFFVAVGMSIDLGELAQRPLEIFGYTAGLIGLKVIVLLPLALLFGYSGGDSVRISFLLAQAGEFGFVLFGSAVALNVIDAPTFIIAVGVISLSMLFTPLLVRVGNSLADHLDLKQRSRRPAPEVLDTTGQQVLIGGYGRMGHTVATLLETSGVPIVALDTSPERVDQGRAYGQAVFYGDVRDPELLLAAHAERASLVVLAIADTDAARQAITHLRVNNSKVPIIARARDLEACADLLEAGATKAFPEALEASLRLGAEALQMLGTADERVDALIDDVREQDYALVRDEYEGEK